MNDDHFQENLPLRGVYGKETLVKKFIAALGSSWMKPPFKTEINLMVFGRSETLLALYLPVLSGHVFIIDQTCPDFNLNNFKAQIKLVKTLERPMMIIDVGIKKGLRKSTVENYLSQELLTTQYQFHNLTGDNFSQYNLLQLLRSDRSVSEITEGIYNNLHL